MILVHGLIHSRLDCSNVFFLGLPQKWIKRLQITQNHAARLVTNCPRRNHISPVLKNLHWLPIAKRVEFKALCLVFRAYWQLGPMYLSNMTQHYCPPRELRSTDALLAIIQSSRSASKGGRRLQTLGNSLWNQLPHQLRVSSSLMAFRKGLKTLHFFTSLQIDTRPSKPLVGRCLNPRLRSMVRE